MVALSLSEIRERLEDVVDRLARGEAVEIAREGGPVLRVVAATPPRKPVDIDALRQLAASLPPQDEDAGTFMRRMRDDYRY